MLTLKVLSEFIRLNGKDVIFITLLYRVKLLIKHESILSYLYSALKDLSYIPLVTLYARVTNISVKE